jgi:hypothetical protein
MVAIQAYLWPLAGVACGTVVVAALRCLTLLVGLKLALRGAPRTDRSAIYREFARALSLKSRTEESSTEMRRTAPSDTDWRTVHERATRPCNR